jgi:hypothetical protein
MNCPRCSAIIAVEDVNVREGIALCRACRNVVRASELVEGAPSSLDLAVPPGAWDVTEGGERRIGATTRSPFALFLVPFMVVWSGGSLGGLYGRQIRSGHFDPIQSVFGIPFILGSLMFWAIALMHVAGRVEVRIRGRDASVFTGVGPIGRTQRFHLGEFTSIREGRGGRGQASIVLEGARRVTFGQFLTPARRFFLAQSLRALM